jgi:hypothetical protein
MADHGRSWPIMADRGRWLTAAGGRMRTAWRQADAAPAARPAGCVLAAWAPSCSHSTIGAAM